ncbi:MAG TPA: carboxypeptidase-like regulatory domain-containing protein [Planctomycetota bacterium]|nr:carboxypeptidase-like regulatory domain-containing protein [Planctomycetota bacterium]
MAAFLAFRKTSITEKGARQSSSKLGPVTPEGRPATLPASPSPATSKTDNSAAIRFVVTMRNQPVPDARITVAKTGTGDFMMFKTEVDGTQWLRALVPWEYGISVEQEDAIPFTTEIFVDSGETAIVTADLKAGGRVTGTITDRVGRPIPDTGVLLLDQATNAPANMDEVKSDKDGHYALKRIASGDFGVRFRHVRFKPLDRMGLVFRGGSEDYRIDVVLEIGAFLSGRVLDESNMPIEGAEILATNIETAGITKSAADGSFSVTGLTDGLANISASKSGYGRIVKRNLPRNSSDVLFRLPKAGTIAGRLKIDFVPAQTQIILSRYDEELRQVIPAESRFFSLPTTATFEVADVAPGSYWVEVQAEGYEAADRPQITVESGRTTDQIVISMRKKN